MQAKDLAQFTLEVAVSGSDNMGEDLASSNSTDDLPVDLKLEDEVRLDRIKFAEESRNDAAAADLRPFEQAVLVAAFTLKQRAQPRDELTNEELLPYLTTILSSKRQSWAMKTSALLLRSKLEGKDSRYASYAGCPMCLFTLFAVTLFRVFHQLASPNRFCQIAKQQRNKIKIHVNCQHSPGAGEDGTPSTDTGLVPNF